MDNIELYKAISSMKEGELFRFIMCILSEYQISSEDYNAISNCVAELAKRGEGYHNRIRRENLNQFIFDTLAMQSKDI